jgi:hypothetical protein
MRSRGIVGLVWSVVLTTVGVLVVLGVANRIPFTRNLVALSLYPSAG